MGNLRIIRKIQSKLYSNIQKFIRELHNQLRGYVNVLNLVKGRIENTPEGKELLSHQLKIVKRLKNKIIDETNREMEMFRKFREFSRQHPEVTYEEFIKANM